MRRIWELLAYFSLLCGFMALGVKMSAAYKKQVSEWQDYIVFLIELKNEMMVHKIPLSYAIHQASDHILQSDIAAVFEELAKDLECNREQGVREIFEKTGERLKVRPGCYLEMDDIIKIQDLGKVLCKNIYGSNHFEEMELYIKNMKKHGEILEHKLPTRQKLTKNIWICIGAVACLLLW